ncbi:MAG: hypothetical protein IPM29_12225 [Planctomycetes bacterium]|nr:hypothetical protein [Planctomycetota bacterium]
MHTATLSIVAAALLCAALPAQESESREPPPGAPWTRSFLDAHRQALASGRPIFVYSTKTY